MLNSRNAKQKPPGQAAQRESHACAAGAVDKKHKQVFRREKT